MLKLCVVLLLFCTITSAVFDDMYYCKYNCTNGETPETQRVLKHAACGCEGVPYCKRVQMTPQNRMSFRDYITHRHNEVRSAFAASSPFGQIANMHVLGYDLEMERVALCHALECPLATEKSHCSSIPESTASRSNTGQTIWTDWTYRSEYLNAPINFMVDKALQSWANEIDNFPKQLVGRYQPSRQFGDGHGPIYDNFACLYWSRLYSLGCGITYKYGLYGRKISHFIVCNYMSMNAEDTNNISYYPCGQFGMEVFKYGTVASKCSLVLKDDLIGASHKYKNLCGKQLDMKPDREYFAPKDRYDQEPTPINSTIVVRRINVSRAKKMQSSTPIMALFIIVVCYFNWIRFFV